MGRLHARRLFADAAGEAGRRVRRQRRHGRRRGARSSAAAAFDSARRAAAAGGGGDDRRADAVSRRTSPRPCLEARRRLPDRKAAGQGRRRRAADRRRSRRAYRRHRPGRAHRAVQPRRSARWTGWTSSRGSSRSTRISPLTFRSIDVGVVLDMMIHDIDIVLKLAGSQVAQIDAVGVSVIGDVEDICNARLTFENGCVANVTASRLALKTERQAARLQLRRVRVARLPEEVRHRRPPQRQPRRDPRRRRRRSARGEIEDLSRPELRRPGQRRGAADRRHRAAAGGAGVVRLRGTATARNRKSRWKRAWLRWRPQPGLWSRSSRSSWGKRGVGGGGWGVGGWECGAGWGEFVKSVVFTPYPQLLPYFAAAHCGYFRKIISSASLYVSWFGRMTAFFFSSSTCLLRRARTAGPRACGGSPAGPRSRRRGGPRRA